VDVLGDASPQRYAETLSVVARDPNSDGLMVILTPQAMTDPTATAEQLRSYANVAGKPVLASWMGGEEIEPGQEILRDSGIPNFPYPDTAARMFNYMWRYNYNLRTLYETPMLPENEGSNMNRAQARNIIEAVRQEGRTLLTEFESKQLLGAYGIPVVETRIAASEDEAAECAAAMGYPVVLKLYSRTITHKTDVGGVQLNLTNEAEVRTAYRAIEQSVGERAGPEHFEGVTVQPMIQWTGYELIIGSSIDAQFGPVLLFGMGGQLVEVFRDRALGLPPLNSTLALRMMERTRIYKALQGVRGRRPVDIEGLQHLLVHFSQLVVEQRLIKEIDINPLLASPDRLIALDARVVLYEPGTSEDNVPPLAIRPYPLQYVATWTAKDGTPLVIRPIRPEDEPLIVKFHETLSEQTVYRRYFGHLHLSDRVKHERLTRICFNDYDRELALVAEHEDPSTRERQIVGVARLSKSRTANDAEFAVLVADEYQRRGIGTELLRRLVEIGREEKLHSIKGEILRENRGMVRASRNVGFEIRSPNVGMNEPAGTSDTVEAYINL
jgi:acetyltransferase